MADQSTRPIKNPKVIINLLPEEQLLRQLLLGCRNSLQSTSETKDLQLWLTGGWVRDKLLGGESTDIDIALSAMTGAQFGTAVYEYFRQNATEYTNEAESLGVTPKVTGYHTIHRNPKKSKHLETTSLWIFGLSVDFANLVD